MRQIVGIILGCALIFAAPDVSSAKTLRQVTTPAENPPASFKGKQYVDSRGCVFIRAGFGGKVTWIPRVNRKRQVYCSKTNTPSLGASQLAALGKKPVIVDTPAENVVKKRVVKKLVRRPAKVAVAKPVVRQIVTAPAVTATKPVVRRQTTVIKLGYSGGNTQQVHPGDLVRSQRRGISPRRQQVETAPIYPGAQQVHPGDVVRSRRLRAAKEANASAYVTPRIQGKVKRVTAAYSTDKVHGLTTVGTIITPDVTALGDAQMALIWTNTVPRRLIKRKVRVRKIRVASSS